MLKSKDVLINHINKQLDWLLINSDLYKDIVMYAFEKYDMPKVEMMDILTFKAALEEKSEFVLFIVLDSIYEIVSEHKKFYGTDKYFTENEIKTYSQEKYVVDKIKFPLRFNMYPVTDDQWIGTIDAKTLMQLRRAQMINYNSETQRVMKKKVRGEIVANIINIQTSSVNKILELLLDRTYISDDITLNIPVDSDAQFYYDEDRKQLVIKKIDMFDITDGYHRYIAICNAMEKDPNFNYNMELRITSFYVDKAQRFIWQKDQKTKMPKLDSESLNTEKLSNIITTRLNEDPRCDFRGLIKRDDSIISYQYFSDIIDKVYLKEVKKKDWAVVRIQMIEKLKTHLNTLAAADIKYLEEKMSYLKTLSVITCFDYYDQNNMSYNGIEKIIEQVNEKISQKDNANRYNSKRLGKTDLKNLYKIIKEEVLLCQI